MPRYAALLRGINLGSRRKVAMADLRALLGRLGFTAVRTHLNSGNAVFTGPAAPTATLAAEIADAIQVDLGLDVGCIVRTADELDAVVAGNPLTEIATEGSKLMVHFLSAAPPPNELSVHDPATLDPDRIAVADRVVYQWCPDGVMGAPFVGQFVEKNLDVTVTARNWNTVTKLAALVHD